MRLAIDKARQGIATAQSPFGACVVRGEELISCEHNGVWETTDSTAHAEVLAIRAACRKLNSIDLKGCTIYSTCEPCPMCFSACHWANIEHIVYGASIEDAQAVGFRELKIGNRLLKELGLSPVQVFGAVLKEECLELFREWEAGPHMKLY